MDAEQHVTDRQRRRSERTPEEGLGTGIGFVIAGLLFAWTPIYLDASAGWRLLWLSLAAMSGGLGVGGALMELGARRSNKGMTNLGIAAFFLTLAVAAFITAQSTVAEGRVETVLKYFVIMAGFFGAIALGQGLGGMFAAPQPERPPTNRSAHLVAFLTALASLAASIVSLVRAGSEKP